MREFVCPETVRVDAYQAGHFTMIPPGMEHFQCSQGIYRRPLLAARDARADLRLISAGLAPFVKLSLEQPFTAVDLAEADDFWSDFEADVRPPYHKPYPWPRAMFAQIIERYGG